jgi:uncharacterized protein YdeI (YjbR/CyaY-like superfamily)
LLNKNSETSCINYNDAVEEALCFGWIDSVKYKRDLESAYQMFTPRKPKSIWSNILNEKIELHFMLKIALHRLQKKLILFHKNRNLLSIIMITLFWLDR